MRGYNFNLDQTKSNVLPPKLQNCTLGRHSERSERLPDSPDARGGAFPEGCFSFPSFHQGGDLHGVPVAKPFKSRRQPTKATSPVFLVFWSSLCVKADGRPPESGVCTRFLPTGEFFLAAVAAYLLRRDQLVFFLIPQNAFRRLWVRFRVLHCSATQ